MIETAPDTVLHLLAKQIGNTLQQQRGIVATAESCTGGGIAYTLTAIAGSSAWFDCGFVTYSNEAKQRLLGVSDDTLVVHGAVSQQTACEMALGALVHSAATHSLSVTGIAGPAGGDIHKPLGTVWIAWASRKGDCDATLFLFRGDRNAVRQQAIMAALNGLLALLEKKT